MGVTEHWARKGIDGWRLDVPAEIHTEGFWEEMRERVRAINPDLYLLGEIWGDAGAWVNDGTRFDGVMNYPMTEAMLRFAAAGNLDEVIIEPVNLALSPALDAAEYQAAVDAHMERYPWDAHLCNLNLLGSHDTPRVRSMLAEDDASVRLAITLQMTFPGTPSVYYADEIGMNGAHDPGSRASFPWGRPDDWNRGLLDDYRALIALRRSEPALRRGTYRSLAAADGLYVFAREAGSDRVMVVVNAGADRSTVDTGESIASRLWGDGLTSGGRVTMPPRSAGIWRIES